MESLATRLFALHRHFAGSEQALQPTANSRVVPAIGDTMRQVANRLRQIQGSAINAIHISGESGTGKEVVADLWHSVQTTRKPFLKVNCAAISPHLLESELFGHVRGAFTGAVSDKSGFLEAASGGSLFLDEVACLSMPAQAALLRALESREIIRVGDTKARSVDLKILSASNLPLESLVSKGLFRNDLLQRLREAEIVLPPLRERKKEICQFIEHFCATEAGGPYRMEDEARRLLENAEWTDGNIRALRNAIRGMTEHQIDRCLTPKSIPAWVWRQIEGSSEFVLQAEPAARSLVIPLPNGEIPQFDQLEDLLFAEAIRYVHKMEGSQSIRTLGEALGIPKTTLANHLSRVRKLGLIPEAELDIIVAAKTKGKG